MAQEDDGLRANVILFVQLNDLYQIDASADYTHESALILPRVATLLTRFRSHYGLNRVYFCLPGDFLAPSCLSKEFYGEQMIDVLNAMGLNFASFGNHEFERDITVDRLTARIYQSQFKWLSTNFEFNDRRLEDQLLTEKKLMRLECIWLSARHLIFLFGILGKEVFPHIGIAHNPSPYVNSVIKMARGMRDDRDKEDPARPTGLSFVALTHQKLHADLALVHECPDLRLIMGGHDHNVREREVSQSCLIVKAASNARTLRLTGMIAVPRDKKDGSALPRRQEEAPEWYRKFAKIVYGKTAISGLAYALLGRKTFSAEDIDLVRGYLSFVTEDGFADRAHMMASRAVNDELIFTISDAIDLTEEWFTRTVPPDPNVQELIERWSAKAIDSQSPIVTAPEDLLLEDNTVRRYSTNFGNLIADIVRGIPWAGEASHTEAEIGLINSGSFRLDRNIQKGEAISQRTLCDIFFHRNAINLYTLPGKVIHDIIRRSLKLRNLNEHEGDGNFLQVSGLMIEVSKWNRIKVYVKRNFGQIERLVPEHSYTVATTTFVSRNAYSKFFNGTPEDFNGSDIRSVVEAALMRQNETTFRVILDSDERWIWKT
jgi:2',3'-cyclic-nucleotide 2'-phosphodiesterase (5'-nucleotidase family)